MAAPNSRILSSSDLLVVEYEDHRAFILRNSNYQGTTDSIKRAFPGLRTLARSSDREIFISALLENFGVMARITQHSWSTVLPTLTCVQANIHVSPLSKINIRSVSLPGERILTLNVDLTVDTIRDLKEMVYHQYRIIPVQQRFTLTPSFTASDQLEDDRILSSYQLRANSTIHMLLSLRGGKPVIYLFPPEPILDVQVQLSLATSWSFSEVYPYTAITTFADRPDNIGQAISWTVDAKPDGTLLDQATGREVAYLFWEAYTNPRPPLSPINTRPNTPIRMPSITFNPANPILLPSQSALLPVGKVTGYIDDVLLALGLHTEARTSFITYWLPNFSKHAFIALRFLSQNQYEKAAPLNITPAPDVTTRVFMLFGGVEESQLEQWDEAVAMASRDVTVWRDVVGVDVGRVQNKSLFRVLEWGGMEVE